MDLELAEFYLSQQKKEKGYLQGTLKVKLASLGISILGVIAVKNSSTHPWRFFMPQKFGIDPDSGEQRRYPIVVFNEPEQTKQFFEVLKERAPDFIEKKLIELEAKESASEAQKCNTQGR